eukprot:COSAG02_NODE_30153_length_556_cov_1.002188_1_plen_53_part_10
MQGIPARAVLEHFGPRSAAGARGIQFVIADVHRLGGKLQDAIYATQASGALRA